ncbi:ABC transporter substrate-binding protein [Desulforhopalus sp. 52FAK]
MASVGMDQIRGIELALAGSNKQILGHPIELQIEDERCTSEGGIIGAMTIVADPRIVATLGTTCSGAAITAGKIISDAGMVMVSGLNTAPSLTAIAGKRGANSQPGYFRVMPSDEMEIQALAAFIFKELGVAKVATISDGDLYTTNHASALKRAFTKLGGEIVLAASVNKGDQNMRPVLTAVALSGAELLFLPLFQPEGNFIVQQSVEIEGLQSLKFLAGDPLFRDDFIRSVDTAATGMYFIAKLAPQSPAFKELISDYEAHYDELPAKHNFGFAYDATNILLNAIEKVAIQESNGTLHIGRHALREALHSTTDFDGVMGRINCDGFGDCGFGNFSIVRFDNMAAGFEGLTSNIIYTHSQK